MRLVRASSTAGVISPRSTPMPERRCGGEKYSGAASKTIAAKNKSAVNRTLAYCNWLQAALNGLDPAAVHGNRNSRDIARAFRRQKHHQIRELFGRANSAE